MTLASPRGVFVTAVILSIATMNMSADSTVKTNTDHSYGMLRSRWAAEVSRDRTPLPEYPRPQMVRLGDNGKPRWTNLNGPWEYAFAPHQADRPEGWEGEILVPFAVESQLSGVQRTPGAGRALWYRRAFARPSLGKDERCLLHFGAVDWDATVWVNGRKLGAHQGGYDAFSFDITDALGTGDTTEVLARVWDPTDAGNQPRGKQVASPRGIYYTPVTGIWQTVWIEPVPRKAIRGLHTTASIGDGSFRISVDAPAGLSFRASARLNGVEAGRGEGPSGTPLRLALRDPQLWAPGSPTIYDLTIELLAGDTVLDRVESYAGLREIGLQRDASGQQRIALNGEITFLLGLLDQGWWPDGLYTAPTDEALRSDIEVTLAMGFNTARKHVKVEPARWYYWADKLGLLVWQDMPSAGTLRFNNILGPDASVAVDDAVRFKRELAAMVDGLRSHPSVIAWTAFNEGWGQHDTNTLLSWLETYDPTRIIGGASGWQDHGHGQLLDLHRYPGPAMPDLNPDRALVLSEYGGIKGEIPGHTWKTDGNWGYGNTQIEPRERLARYAEITAEILPLIRAGLSAAIYTQTTDVEVEINGLITYDRSETKFPIDWLRRAHAPLYNTQKLTKSRIILPAARDSASVWRHTTTQPGSDWHSPAFDDSAWTEGAAPFGDPKNTYAPAHTPWTTEKIWIRRFFEVADPQTGDLMLRVHNNDDAEVYLNGVLLRKTGGWSPFHRLEPTLPAGATALRKGKNVIAVSCENTSAGKRPHFLDVGLVDFQ